MPRRSRFRPGEGLFEAMEQRMLLTFNPTAEEQYMLELLNHMRADPLANLALMTSSLGNPARSNHPGIDLALRQFNVSGTALSQQWATLVSAPPLAWNANLYLAAEGHTQVMIDTDSQTHQAPGEPDLGERIRNAGYTNFSTAAENVYAYSTGTFYGHAGFSIDWGESPTGIQTPPGHRDNMMSAAFREVGIRILSESNPQTSVGPFLVTQNFGSRFNFGDPFLLGVVYSDANRDRFYAPGEGLGGVTVQAVGAAGTFTTTSMDAGGYQLKIPSGIYTITFAGPGFGSPVTHHNVSISSSNFKLDGIRGDTPPVPNIVLLGNGVAIAAGDTTPAAEDWTDFGLVNLAQTLTRTFTIRNTGGAPLRLLGSPRVRMTGGGVSSYGLVQDAAGLIQPGEETTFTIRFEPAGTTNAPINLTLQSDDPYTPTYTVRIRGRGQNAPDIDVGGSIGGPLLPILNGDTTPRLADGTGFNALNIVRQTRIRTFTISNSGSRPLNLSTADSGPVTIAGRNAADFVVLQQPDAVVQPGGFTTFRIRFNPAAVGARQGLVRIASNDPDESTFEFSIRGTGRAAPIVRLEGGDTAIVTGAPASQANGTHFGQVAAGAAFVVHTFTIKNVGSAPLALKHIKRHRIRITGGGAENYRVGVQPAAQSVPIDGSLTFRVRFEPGTEGAKLARVVIDTLNAGTFHFNIRGAGI